MWRPWPARAGQQSLDRPQQILRPTHRDGGDGAESPQHGERPLGLAADVCTDPGDGRRVDIGTMTVALVAGPPLDRAGGVGELVSEGARAGEATEPVGVPVQACRPDPEGEAA